MRNRIFNIVTAIVLSLSSSQIWAEEGKFEGLMLAKAPVDYHDMESIKRGAKLFATNCMSCHTMVYLRYNKLAQEAGVTYEKMPINVKSWPNGVTPPDLSLEADVRGVDWIYTYLHSFYQDLKRPTGVNNLLVPDTAMPGILTPYQGEQILVENPVADYRGHFEWYDLLKQTKQGTMTPEEFDKMTTDLVNFMAYAAQPYRPEQQRLGLWVLGFLAILFVLTYMLKNEYWKDVKKHKDE